MNNIRLSLLNLLHKNKDQYISGEKMSNELGVSRTAVWKHVKELRESGYNIKSCPNVGYALKEISNKIIPEEVKLRLKTELIGQEIRVFKKLDSSNQKAKIMAVKGAKNGTIVIAEEQDSGRGRLGRDWYSPPDTGLWFSVILRPDFKPEKAPLLTVAASLAVATAFDRYELNPEIKWPNDILLTGNKVCGILSEMSADLDKINYAVIGIGINVNQSKFPDYLREIATSMKIKLGFEVNRNKLLAQVLNSFNYYYKLLLDNKNVRLIDYWQQRLNLLNKTVALKSKGHIYKGKAVGVSPEGELLIKTNDHIKSFWAGDATVVKEN